MGSKNALWPGAGMASISSLVGTGAGASSGGSGLDCRKGGKKIRRGVPSIDSSRTIEPQPGPADGDHRSRGKLRGLRLNAGAGLARNHVVRVIGACQKQLNLRGPSTQRSGFRVRLRPHPPDGPVQFSGKIDDRRLRSNHFTFAVFEQVCSIAINTDPPFPENPAALFHRQGVRAGLIVGDDLIAIEAGAVEDVSLVIEDKSASAVTLQGHPAVRTGGDS